MKAKFTNMKTKTFTHKGHEVSISLEKSGYRYCMCWDVDGEWQGSMMVDAYIWDNMDEAEIIGRITSTDAYYEQDIEL